MVLRYGRILAMSTLSLSRNPLRGGGVEFDHAVRASGATAMVVPSAALPGTHNLIVFGERLLTRICGNP